MFLFIYYTISVAKTPIRTMFLKNYEKNPNKTELDDPFCKFESLDDYPTLNGYTFVSNFYRIKFSAILPRSQSVRKCSETVMMNPNIIGNRFVNIRIDSLTLHFHHSDWFQFVRDC